MKIGRSGKCFRCCFLSLMVGNVAVLLIYGGMPWEQGGIKPPSRGFWVFLTFGLILLLIGGAVIGHYRLGGRPTNG